jgi:zinc protease
VKTLGRALLISLATFAPIPAARAQEITQVSPDTATTIFTVSGVTVLHRRLTTSEIVVAQLYLLGGSRQLTYNNAGIEALMLGASEYGTLKYPGRLATVALARTGSSINVGTTLDWSVLELRTVRSELDSAWSVFADRITNPELSTNAVSIVRDRMYLAEGIRESDPDGLIEHLADSIAFNGHPYAIDPSGSERSLRLMRSTDVAAYHKAQTVTSRMLLVVVGNITAGEIERLVSTTLAKLPKGQYVWSLPPELPVRDPTLTSVSRPLATNYLLGYFPGPPVGSRDYSAFRVATALLGGKLAYVIREERKLSYAAYAPFLDRAVSAGGVYVSTSKPEEVLPLIRQTIAEVMGNALSWGRLSSFVSQFTIEFLLDQETYDGQASELARAHLLRGDFRKTSAWLTDLKLVSPIMMQNVSRRYFNNIQYVYVGDTAAINRAFRR